uniref:Putative LAGLIDADG homing endonuclease n=1 Tax=Treubaria triappendiculata TaxID=1755147 RepID=A0A0S2LN85_TRETR|nr:putative LAGLIDADG homing endonuclease [Treubaria triappendiculata]ALO62682.1 putative LAGLIDADG homing endonuclease [Treubaria triappendiculata]
MNTSLSESASCDILAWNEYLSGLIDGDGSLLVSNKGYGSLEITMGICDEHALNKVKQKLGGSVKLRSGARAFRYRLHDKQGMIDLINRINGSIRNSKTIAQLKIICAHYKIEYQKPKLLTLDNSWFAGFFDAEGTIGYSFKKGDPQLTISVSNKNRMDLLSYQEFFDGFIRWDKASNTHKWDLYSKEAILFFYEYLQKHPLHSAKKKRFFLLKRFYLLVACRAYRAERDSILFRAWKRFDEKWNTF